MDQEIKCVDCGNDFLFPEGEKKFYELKGLQPPKRCAECRFKKKQKFAEKETKQQQNA